MLAAPLHAAEPEAWRVVLDRLTWAPDGSAIAVEARTISPHSVETDTLLVDLSRGRVRFLVQGGFPWVDTRDVALRCEKRRSHERGRLTR